jgi:hypothetical protein
MASGRSTHFACRAQGVTHAETLISRISEFEAGGRRSAVLWAGPRSVCMAAASGPVVGMMPLVVVSWGQLSGGFARRLREEVVWGETHAASW